MTERTPAPQAIPSYDHVDLTVGDPAGGSNDARFAFDQAGNRWFIKAYNGNTNRVAVEVAANAVYRAMGIPVPVAGTKIVNGRPAIAYPTIDGTVGVPIEAPSKDLGRGYMTDALLASWDVIGLMSGNVLWRKDGTPVRLDQGGTMNYRAMGAEKDFGPTPSEVWTLKLGQARTTMDVSLTDMRQQAALISRRITPGLVDHIFDAAPFESVAMRDGLKIALKSRVAWMAGFARGEVALPSLALRQQQAIADAADRLNRAQADVRRALRAVESAQAKETA